jgi:hypothetical protein
MCWAAPRLIEVVGPAERAAIHAYWRPKTALAAFRAADHQPARRVAEIASPDDGLDIPPFLDRRGAVPHDRRPALGPPGDSLDDLQ